MPLIIRALVSLLIAALPVAAQSIPGVAKVKVGAATVRGTPGEFAPETGRLERGAEVTVVSAEGNDWLAIQPPKGSVSWVQWTLVEPQGKPGPDGKFVPPFNAVVTAEDTAVRAGAVGESKPLMVQRTKLPKGTLVRVLAAKVPLKLNDDSLEANWYPIEAPKDDLRYVRRADVDWAGTAPGPGFVVKTGGTTSKPLPGVPAVSPTPDAGRGSGDFTLSIPGERPAYKPNLNKPADWPNNYPLWKDAEKARDAGDARTARELYTQLAAEVNREGAGQDLELANLCYDRIYNALGTTTGGGTTAPTRPVEPPAYKPDPPVLKADPPKVAAGKTASGYLIRSKAMLDGKWRIYLLYDRGDVLREYVVSDGPDLDRLNESWVELTGRTIRAESLKNEPVFVATDARAR
jgi:hypothetical protein